MVVYSKDAVASQVILFFQTTLNSLEVIALQIVVDSMANSNYQKI